MNSAAWELAEKYLPSFAEFSKNEMGSDFNFHKTTIPGEARSG